MTSVSVVVPSHLGAGHLARCLRSLAGQTLAVERYEVLVILNGPDDGSDRVVAAVRDEFPNLNLRLLRGSVASASSARNVGLDAVSMDYVTFVDDDDWVSPRYLQGLLEVAAPGVVGIGHLRDVTDDGSPAPTSYVAPLISARAGEELPVPELPAALSFNACKIFPAAFSSSLRYHEELKSGEDVVFFVEMFAASEFTLRVCEEDADVTYFRHTRANSVSRQSDSFDFSVRQRVEVIARLHRLADRGSEDVRRVAISRMNGQARFINDHLRHNPSRHADVVRLTEQRQLASFPYSRVNAGLASTLVISYCFPPYSDTSAVVMAKRVRARGEVVDVVSNRMDGARGTDPTLHGIAAPFVEKHMLLRTEPKFSSWRAFEEFRRVGMKRIRQQEETRGRPYDRVYSRAMWPASNILAAHYKLRHPRSFWTAEFSDPISRNIEGHERGGGLQPSAFVERLSQAFLAKGLPVPETTNGMYWCEYMALALADSVVFTNVNQMEYMLSYQPPQIADRVRARAVISPHPVLGGEFYQRLSSRYDLHSNTVNIGYFGSYYKTRGLGDVVRALATSADVRAGVRLHVFTNQVDQAASEVAEAGLTGSIAVAPYVDFLEFLNLTTRFDCLLVVDTVTGSSHEHNPYLPSKWSDYRGSGSLVWGVVEPGSILDSQPLDLRSEVGDVEGAADVLQRLAARSSGLPAA